MNQDYLIGRNNTGETSGYYSMTVETRSDAVSLLLVEYALSASPEMLESLLEWLDSYEQYWDWNDDDHNCSYYIEATS